MNQDSMPRSCGPGSSAAARGWSGASAAVLGGGTDDEAWERVEEALIAADLGADLSIEVVERARAPAGPTAGAGAPGRAHRAVRDPRRDALAAQAGPTRPRSSSSSGVNGTGKTTTIAKLAYRFKTRGARVLLAAADTFRAAAIEQLQAWADAHRRARGRSRRQRRPVGRGVGRHGCRGGTRHRRRHRGHRRSAAHQEQPDGRAGQDPAHHRASGCRRRTPEVAVRARRDDRPERAPAGAGVPRVGRSHRRSR